MAFGDRGPNRSPEFFRYCIGVAPHTVSDAPHGISLTSYLVGPWARWTIAGLVLAPSSVGIGSTMRCARRVACSAKHMRSLESSSPSRPAATGRDRPAPNASTGPSISRTTRSGSMPPCPTPTSTPSATAGILGWLGVRARQVRHCWGSPVPAPRRRASSRTSDFHQQKLETDQVEVRARVGHALEGPPGRCQGQG